MASELALSLLNINYLTNKVENGQLRSRVIFFQFLQTKIAQYLF